MKKVFCGSTLLALILSLFVFASAGTAHAATAVSLHPANCGVRSIESTANTAYGDPFVLNSSVEIPAHVKVVIWQSCTSNYYYASAYSTSDNERNWSFAGNLVVHATTHGVTSTTSRYCNTPACDSSSLLFYAGSSDIQAFYTPTNGHFQMGETNVATNYYQG